VGRDQNVNSKKTLFMILQKLQYVLFIGAVLLTVGAAYYFVTANRQPAELEEFIAEYSYNHKAVLDYEVVLKPNSLYEEPVLGSGRSYFTKTVENINVMFSYDFSGSSPAPLEGTYGINAVVTSGEIAESREIKVPLWKKEFELIPPTPFSENSSTVNIRENLSIYLEDYREIVNKLQQELGVTTNPNRLVLEGWVKTTVQAGSENINKQLKSELVFPLGQAHFSSSGDRIASGNDTVGKTVVITLHDVLEQRQKATKAVVLSGSLTALLVLIICVQLKPKLAEKKKMKKHQIPRRFRERIVEAEMRAELPPGKPIVLKSLEELIRIADEVARPVVLQNTAKGNSRYYVFDGEIRYEYIA
jgi:hypothetical protein